MAIEEEITKITPIPCTYSFNWAIIDGSFDDSLTFESSDSPIGFNNSIRRSSSPLLLKPYSKDSGPCEIKISFARKQEIRQVYIRSTARTYEIYYVPELQSGNEYLCTVRCSIVANGEDFLCKQDVEEAIPANLKGSDGESFGKKSTTENIGGTSEDDWVEVNSDSPPHDHGNISLRKDTDADSRILRDFYEATAEISDADQCISLVLRLLSLEDKGCVYVDEVYVYADPVESFDVEENQAVPRLPGSFSGNSLLAMFMPTLLHMTKSGVGQLQNKSNSSIMGEPVQTDKVPTETDSASYLNGTRKEEKYKSPDFQDVKFQDVSGVSAEASRQFQIPLSVSEKERECSSSGASNDSHLGRVIEQLISRVSRIEDICLRFEQNMLKPINSMEARLQRVEDQLEVIAKNNQYSGFPSGVRFSAPAFSSLDSSSSSFYYDGSANPQAQSEMEKQDAPIDVTPSSDNNSKSVMDPNFLPILVVTAPEFSCGEEDEENDIVVIPKESTPEKQKQTLSINDALAAALAGFSSMTGSEPLKPSDSASKSTRDKSGIDESLKYAEIPTVVSHESTNSGSVHHEPSKCTQSLKITAPDFSSEDSVYDDKAASPKTEKGAHELCDNSLATNGNEHTSEWVSASSNTSLVETQVENPLQFNKISEGSDTLDKLCEEQRDGSVLATAINSPSPHAIDNLSCYHTAEEPRNRASKVCILDRFEILRQLLDNQTKDSGIDNVNEVTSENCREVEKGSDEDLLVEITHSSNVYVLDFETPILDVKFNFCKDSSFSSGLEVLLTDAVSQSMPSLVQESDGVINMEPNYWSPFQDEGKRSTNNRLLVDVESFDAPLISEITVGVQEPLTSFKQEIVGSLI